MHELTWFAVGFATCATVVYIVDTIRSMRPTYKRLSRTLPNAHIEMVGGRQEAVVFTGWTIHQNGRLVAMDEFLY